MKVKGHKELPSDPLQGADSVIHLISREAGGFISERGSGHSNFQIGRVVLSYRRDREMPTSEYCNNYMKKGLNSIVHFSPTTCPPPIPPHPRFFLTGTDN